MARYLGKLFFPCVQRHNLAQGFLWYTPAELTQGEDESPKFKTLAEAQESIKESIERNRMRALE